MKDRLGLLYLSVLMLSCCLLNMVVSSCVKEEDELDLMHKTCLQVPTPQLEAVGFNTATLSWSPIPGATCYNVYFEADEYPVISIDTFIVIKGLTPQTTYHVAMTAKPASQSKFAESEKSATIAFQTLAKPRLDAPALSVRNITTTSFEASWSVIEKAGSYTAVLADKAKSDTLSFSGDTVNIWSGLVPGTEYNLSIVAVPNEDNKQDWGASEPSVCIVQTLLPGQLPAPNVIVEKATVAEAVFSWDEVEGASSYKWYLDDSKDITTSNGLSAKVTGLAEGSEHVFHVCSCSADQDVFTDSNWQDVVFSVVIPKLASPVITIESASCYTSRLSWTADPDALKYEWKLDADIINETTENTVSFENLEKDSHHVFFVRAISPDTKLATDSDWASVEFDAVDNFISTLKISDAEVSGNYAKFLASVISGEEYYMGFALKAKYLGEDNQVDKTALVSDVLASLSATADELVSIGTYSTRKEAIASLVRNKTTRLQSAALYHSAQYLCYAFDVNVGNCTAMSDLQYLELTTGEHIQEQGSYCSSSLITLTTNLAYGYSSSNGVYDNTNYVAFSISTESGSVNCSEVKYTLLPLSTYNSSIGSAFDSSVEGAVKSYFNSNGSTMAASYLTKLNEGTSYSSGYAKRSENSTYVALARAVTAANDTLVAVSAVKTCAASSSWLTIIGESPSKFTISSKLPIISGKYYCGTLTSANNTPKLQESFMETKGIVFTDANIASINSEGLTKSFSSMTSGKTYCMIVQVTSITGETITRCCPLRIE